MRIEFALKDYEQVRSELRYYTKNQFNLLITLLTLCVAIFEYSLTCSSPDKMVALSTGFVIPALFAYIGVLWINQVYRQKELAYYSLLLEHSITNSKCVYNGWESFVHSQHPTIIDRIGNLVSEVKNEKVCSKDRMKKLIRFISQLFLSANLYYYGLVVVGLIITPAAFSHYCTRQIKVLDAHGIEYSSLCGLRWWITIIFYIILLLYVLNILLVQHDIKREKRKSNIANTADLGLD